ncbi:ATP-binding protein [Mycoplasma feriruminatoris]|uniref:ATPase AAA n=1 Tax=Mycoplasma feriruminatoris TaxID=1179777 RepID=A0AAQ3HY86_9MOLU|nr:ATP-binding protein [Mycoplasma feriruminatoris]UKS54475.1 divergent AAA domain protein [Mycoplasma feriruminatoris]WFQ92163.1 hypothetical protein MFERI14815_00780 [Mycoplasma feriruminatoris]WFQ93005.1 hypothetical protein MFERI14822_00798 [Mycoplasma feriruminatoris]WFQ93855.1 ATPase AAA [Mycoplasma feriruminatoris]WFQ94692.1 hypothetical protein MFERI15220_00774 [Mycoplasma feriruminatoris]
MSIRKYNNPAIIHKEKNVSRKSSNWLKAACAFANMNGGTLIFGIKNSLIVGLKNIDSDYNYINEQITKLIEPKISFNIEIKTYEDKQYIEVNVFKTNNQIYTCNIDQVKNVYLKTKRQIFIANSFQLQDLVLKQQNTTYDALQLNIKKENASFTKLRSIYYQLKKKNINIQTLKLIDKDYLTNAGALFSDGCLVYQSKILATKWLGVDKTSKVVNHIEFQGDLLYLFKSAKKFIKKNSNLVWLTRDYDRIGLPDYPSQAINESIINALIHRDYKTIGSEIHIDMYDNRIEIYSPGGMYDASLIQEQNVFKLEKQIRNPILANVFFHLGLTKNNTTGLKTIINDYKNQFHYNKKLKPKFFSTNSSFVVTLYNLNYNRQ